MEKFILLFLVILFSSCKKNELKVSIGNLPNKLTISLGTTDFKDIIYHKSIQILDIPNEYGENDWKIIYSDTLCIQFRHFKTNRNDLHNYNFALLKKENDLYCNVNINGISNFNKLIKFTKCQ